MHPFCDAQSGPFVPVRVTCGALVSIVIGVVLASFNGRVNASLLAWAFL